MSYQQKLDEARALLSQHNSQLDDSSKLNIDNFFNKLKAAGGTTDDALKMCAFEDLESFGAPKLLARQIATIFRKSDRDEVSPEKKYLKPSRVAAMSVRELMEAYDPLDCTNAVGERLKKIVGEKRVIVFNSDNSVNAEASTKLVNELRDGYDERETCPVNGVPVKVYKVGERPGMVADENPLYPNRPLRPGGDCDQTNRSWSGVSDLIRIVVYLAVTRTKEIKIDSLMDAHGVLDFVMAADEGKTRSRFQKASLLYDDLKAEGKLPAMKIARKSSTDKCNNPFGTPKTF